MDIVYVDTPEAQKEVDPYAAFAVMGELVYEPGVSGHGTAQTFFTDRETRDIVQGGGVDTRKGNVLIRFINDNGRTGQDIIISTEDYSKTWSGTRRAYSMELLSDMKKRATVASMKNKNQALTPENNDIVGSGKR